MLRENMNINPMSSVDIKMDCNCWYLTLIEDLANVILIMFDNPHLVNNFCKDELDPKLKILKW